MAILGGWVFLLSEVPLQVARMSKLAAGLVEKELFIDNLLVRIHFVIEIIWWTGLASWEFEFPFQVALHLP